MRGSFSAMCPHALRGSSGSPCGSSRSGPRSRRGPGRCRRDKARPAVRRARPFDGGDALRLGALVFGVAFGKRGDVVDKHCVEDAVFVDLLRTVAGVEVAGDAFVLEDDSPRNNGRVRREKSAAWGKGKRLHISHDTLEDVSAARLQTAQFRDEMRACRERDSRMRDKKR
jgi:hypothetical protein